MTTSPGSSRSSLLPMSIALGAMVVARVLLGFITVPVTALAVANLAVTTLFLTVPILGLYFGARYKWDPIRAIVTIIIGVVAQFGLIRLGSTVHQPLLASILIAVSQTGLIVWCLGVGAFLATILKDKNLILPIAIFLALFDIWLVFAPMGRVGQIARGNQAQLAKVAYQLPKATSHATGAVPQALAYVGPADFLFLAMFFVALYRFRMRTRETFNAIVPTLIAYLFTVLLFGWVKIGPISLAALPALLPIGSVILWVNRREFKLTKDEKLATGALAIFALGLVIYGFWWGNR